jgi:hypothetical protein
MQFSGVVRVTWLDHGKPNDITVSVIDDNGAIEVESGQARVFDSGTRTYFKNRLGWSSALIEPLPENVPAPDHRWTLRVRPGPTIVGRPTRLIEATRSNGSAAQKLYLDHDTNLLLRRDVLDDRGQVQRSLTFLDLDIEAGPACTPAACTCRRRFRSTTSRRDTSPERAVGLCAHRPVASLEWRRAALQRRAVHGVDARATASWRERHAGGGTAVEVGGNDAARYSARAPTCSCGSATARCSRACRTPPPDVIGALVAGSRRVARRESRRLRARAVRLELERRRPVDASRVSRDSGG